MKVEARRGKVCRAAGSRVPIPRVLPTSVQHELLLFASRPASSVPMMTPLDLVKLTPLMERTRGSEIAIGPIDGPVAMGHPDLAGDRLREIPSGRVGACLETNSTACRHRTFVIGILAARRSSAAPAISPGCRFLIRAIFSEQVGGEQLPRTRFEPTTGLCPGLCPNTLSVPPAYLHRRSPAARAAQTSAAA